jgi:hypothetical protein
MSQKLHQWIDFLDVIMKRRRLVAINFLAVSILAAVFSLILPKVYRAQTTILLRPRRRCLLIVLLISKMSRQFRPRSWRFSKFHSILAVLKADHHGIMPAVLI